MTNQTSPLQSRLRQIRDRQTTTDPIETVTAAPMWSLQGAIFQETALQVLDQRGSKAHQAIGRFVTDLNAMGTIDAADVPAAVKDAMARWSQLLWTD